MPTVLKNLSSFQRHAPAQARSKVTVGAILEASARIILKDGLPGLTTNRIADMAGVSVGTLYGYFPNKSAIIVALGRQILEQDEAAIRAALNADEAGFHDTSAKHRVVIALITRHRTDPALRRIVMAQHVGLGLGGEHADRAQVVMREVALRLTEYSQAPSDPSQIFIVTRAILGVCRALTEEDDATVLDSEVLATELVRMLDAYTHFTRTFQSA